MILLNNSCALKSRAQRVAQSLINQIDSALHRSSGVKLSLDFLCRTKHQDGTQTAIHGSERAPAVQCLRRDEIVGCIERAALLAIREDDDVAIQLGNLRASVTPSSSSVTCPLQMAVTLSAIALRNMDDNHFALQATPIKVAQHLSKIHAVVMARARTRLQVLNTRFRESTRTRHAAVRNNSEQQRFSDSRKLTKRCHELLTITHGNWLQQWHLSSSVYIKRNQRAPVTSVAIRLHTELQHMPFVAFRLDLLNSA